MKKSIKIILAVIASIWVIACYDVLENKGIEDDTVKNGITVKEAAEVFQQKIIDYEILKSKGNLPENPLLPRDYTPQWDKAVYSENEYIWSIEAPIIDSRRLLATSHLNERKPWEASITQKVVVIKVKETHETEMFLLSLIPDRKCFEKYRHHRGRTYTHAGNTRKFSGTAVYTLWEGTNILINEHNNDSVTQKFKYDRKKSFYVQKDFSTAVIGESGGLVLMDYYGGELEGSVVIGRNPGDKLPEYCPYCHYSNCHCWQNDDGSGGGGDYFPPGYTDPGGGSDSGNTNPQPTKYTVTVSISGNGTVTGYGTSASNISGAGVYEYNQGTYLGITAVVGTGYKFTGWQGDISGTSASIWIENLSKNMSVTANFASKAEPYTARPDDKKFKNNFATTMQEQLVNTCVASIMAYIEEIICGANFDMGKYLWDYARDYKVWLYETGMPTEHIQPFIDKYFVSGNFTSWQAAIDAGRVVFTDVPSNVSGSSHAVLVVGYGADGSLIYMDPEEGSLIRADADYIVGTQKIVIRKCQ
ncbi:MAG: hypothetical protein LBJ63_04355 [Prevotellaceae bacterium]|nr:hypothetical protein [Prevotellaceae bacterium]